MGYRLKYKTTTFLEKNDQKKCSEPRNKIVLDLTPKTQFRKEKNWKIGSSPNEKLLLCESP